MAAAEGFRFDRRKSGEVAIFRHGKLVTMLRGAPAQAFLDEMAVNPERAQAAMARLTGNYRRGNERAAAIHPRNAR